MAVSSYDFRLPKCRYAITNSVQKPAVQDCHGSVSVRKPLSRAVGFGVLVMRFASFSLHISIVIYNIIYMFFTLLESNCYLIAERTLIPHKMPTAYQISIIEYIHHTVVYLDSRSIECKGVHHVNR